ncbi:LysR family transcriptional regulator [Zavarzinia compransoris]|uniref:LysR family transcriptional regulator n=1 Tax=Zavarzinia compransoris TaxID=1264899 RepID=A0A317DWW0_9PROT|nr:LysR family transcriptional regulator [Zavarzinia compransoris]PWR19011.1 LysR family transcriptional regulator [Zavarzinia compransoris]TDP49014.1 LysR family transcriptional regulator [Zavarzinia compransoris]
MSDEPSWEFYRSFLAVLDEGSLSAAARALGLTQPTVGHHIEGLETALGVPLFTRSPRGLTPTETARLIRPQAAAMAAAAAVLRRRASAGAGAAAGTVRITASDVVGGAVLPPILADLRRREPGIRIELSLSNRAEDLSRQDADLAIRMVAPTQGALVARHIGEIRLGLFAAPDYVARRGLPGSLADLAGHDLIGPDRDTAAIRGVPGAERLNPEGFTLRVDHQVAQLAMVRAGCGIGVCQCALALEPALVPVLADDFAPRLPVWLVVHEDLWPSRRIRLVFDALAAALQRYTRLA